MTKTICSLSRHLIIVFYVCFCLRDGSYIKPTLNFHFWQNFCWNVKFQNQITFLLFNIFRCGFRLSSSINDIFKDINVRFTVSRILKNTWPPYQMLILRISQHSSFQTFSLPSYESYTQYGIACIWEWTLCMDSDRGIFCTVHY